MTSGNFDGEEWRSVVGFEGIYEVSNHGRVKRVARARGTRVGHILKADLRYDKCWVVVLRAGPGTRSKTYYVHHLVAEAFIVPIPKTHTVNHLDGDRSNNHISNLEVVTWEQNREHARLTGLIPRGTRHHFAKLNPDAVRDIRARAGTVTIAQLAREYGVSASSVKQVLTGQCWSHVT